MKSFTQFLQDPILLRDHDKAVYFAKKALKQNPHSLEARQVLGYALYKLGHTIDAQNILKQIGK